MLWILSMHSIENNNLVPYNPQWCVPIFSMLTSPFFAGKEKKNGFGLRLDQFLEGFLDSEGESNGELVCLGGYMNASIF